jgi:hypothetical protein
VESESKAPTGQVVWLQAPTNEDDAVRFQLQTWNDRDPTVYALPLCHGAFHGAQHAPETSIGLTGTERAVRVEGAGFTRGRRGVKGQPPSAEHPEL